jgi:hypothetical protein
VRPDLVTTPNVVLASLGRAAEPPTSFAKGLVKLSRPSMSNVKLGLAWISWDQHGLRWISADYVRLTGIRVD